MAAVGMGPGVPGGVVRGFGTAVATKTVSVGVLGALAVFIGAGFGELLIVGAPHPIKTAMPNVSTRNARLIDQPSTSLTLNSVGPSGIVRHQTVFFPGISK